VTTFAWFLAVCGTLCALGGCACLIAWLAQEDKLAARKAARQQRGKQLLDGLVMELKWEAYLRWLDDKQHGVVHTEEYDAEMRRIGDSK
jgi:hypothetical protein